MGDVPEQVAQQLAAVMHTANDGEDCNCHAAAREEFEVCAEVALTWLAERGLLAATPDGPRRWALPDGVTHNYLSTACLHDQHEHCAAMVGYQGVKRPAQCKFCEARCICPVCRHDQSTDATPAADGQDGDGRG